MVQSKSVEQPSGLKQIFSDLSFPQVTAGALAAVTSMLLASNVGIAGTVIGVAVSSVVSAVASQVYKQFILASAEKVKDLAPASLIPSGSSSRRGSERDSIVPEEITASVERIPERRTRVFNPQETRRTAVPSAYAVTAARPSVVVRHRPASVTMGDEYARSAILQARAARERKAKIQRNTIIVAVISAIVAVAVCALMINVATQGKGLGPQMPTATYMQKWSNPSVQQESDVSESDEEASSENEEKAEAKGDSSQANKTNKTGKTNGATGSNSKVESSAGSSVGSTHGSSNNSSSTNTSQTPESGNAAEGDSEELESSSQGGQEGAEDSATDSSSGAEAAGATESTSSKANTR